MLSYLQLDSSADLPVAPFSGPFKAVVIIHHAVSPERRTDIGRWLVDSGCRYVMAWGADCDSLRESVERANREAFDFGDIPDDRIVIATSHGQDSLADVFWFSKHTAMHPCVPLDDTVLIHLSPIEREAELKSQFSGV